MTRVPCQLAGCDRQPVGRGMCGMHYQRFLISGDPGEAECRHNPNPPETCTVTNCDRPHRAKGFCSMHWTRWRKHGDPTIVRKPPGFQSGEDHPDWKGDDVSYRGLHTRLISMRGPASLYFCVDCGGVATTWSYDHKDPDEKPGRSPYSTDLHHYEPRCRSCHWRLDGTVANFGGSLTRSGGGNV